ncbi:MAG TPA: hypothetical protein VFD63_21510, partial [Pyrinomonadaceae bacterium]|nr:hypothetical protein [Pyrinomonadaceae bacterium]
MIKRFLSLVVSVLLVAPVCVFPQGNPEPSTARAENRTNAFKPEPSASALAWANAELGRMSLEEKIGQLISVGVNATFLNQDSESFQVLKHFVEDDKVG